MIHPAARRFFDGLINAVVFSGALVLFVFVLWGVL